MPRVGFEPKISAGERPKTYALDRAATGTGSPMIDNYFKCNFIFVNMPHRKDKCTNTLYDYAIINYTGQQNLTFLAHEEKYLILIELLKLNSNV